MIERLRYGAQKTPPLSDGSPQLVPVWLCHCENGASLLIQLSLRSTVAQSHGRKVDSFSPMFYTSRRNRPGSSFAPGNINSNFDAPIDLETTSPSTARKSVVTARSRPSLSSWSLRPGQRP
jgi:hypothetical protein